MKDGLSLLGIRGSSSLMIPRRLKSLILPMFLLPGTSHGAIDFKTQVYPILEAHCFKCHGEKKQKGDLRLDTLSTDFLNDRAAAETWHDIRDVLNLGEMPRRTKNH